MATSNAEILAQLESLAESKLSGEVLSCYSHSRSALSCRADLTDFAAILTKFKRLVKIEEAAREARRKRHLTEAIHEQQMERSVEKELPMTYEAHKPYFEAADEAGRAEAALDAALKEPQ